MPAFKQPTDVFTPRDSKVNELMYISRPDLEKSLIQGLQGTKHLIIHGESGSGKSWLYKKVLRDINVKYKIVNLANASRLGSINQAFQILLDREEEATKTSYSEEKKAGAGVPGVASGGLSHTGHFTISRKEPFEAVLQELERESRGSFSVLVLDNLERIIENDKLLNELADLITLLDDDIYAEYRVKFIIVGVPNDLTRYFFNTPSFTTVGNRLQEIPEVFRFSEEQTKELVLRGFVNELGILKEGEEILDKTSDHIIWVTDRIPQRIHEYCLKLAFEAFEKRRWLCEADLKVADRKWLEESLYESYSAIEASMNEKDTKAQRRNQVIYALGRINKSGFRYTDIEGTLRRHFPKSTEGTQLNVSGILSYLASQDKPLIRKSPKSDTYVFCNPVYRMCIRCMLKINPRTEKIVKRELNTLENLDQYLF